jgi:two-component system response regulator NreC
MIRILLADDHPILRAGLRMLVSSGADMEVVAEAGDAAMASAEAARTQPDVAVLDLDMPGGGIGAIPKIHEVSPATRVLVLTIHDDLAYLRAALAAGGVGYLVKTAADTDLLNAVRTVRQGRTYIDVALRDSGEPQAATRADDGVVHPSVPLSERELQVLELVALGYTHREIAEQVQLSIKTVETYRARVAEKLALRTRAELVRYALETGILAPGSDDDAAQAG